MGVQDGETGERLSPMIIDHRDGSTLNNRRVNLRAASHIDNSRNRRLQRQNKSGFKGVSLHESGRWQAQIHTVHGQKYLGRFQTKEEAAGAYDAAAISIFGEFAWINGDRRP